MKTREVKQKDLVALTDSLQNSKSAMVVSFTKLTVTKDQEFRNSVRAAGAQYQVVKNTLARIAVKGTQFEDTTEYLKGVTAIAWTDNDPVILSKAIAKFMKDNADIYTFKTGVVDGKLVDLQQLTTIANLPSKEELISKLLWVINSSAQGIVTVINAVPRNLAVVIKQIGEQKEGPAPAVVIEAKAEETTPAVVEEVAAPVEAEAAPAIEDEPSEKTAVEAAHGAAEPAEEVPNVEVETAPVADTAADEEILEIAPDAEAEEKAE